MISDTFSVTSAFLSSEIKQASLGFEGRRNKSYFLGTVKSLCNRFFIKNFSKFRHISWQISKIIINKDTVFYEIIIAPLVITFVFSKNKITVIKNC